MKNDLQTPNQTCHEGSLVKGSLSDSFLIFGLLSLWSLSGCSGSSETSSNSPKESEESPTPTVRSAKSLPTPPRPGSEVPLKKIELPKEKTTTTKFESKDLELESASPLVAKPGETVTLTGKNFLKHDFSQIITTVQDVPVSVTVKSDTVIEFTMPEGTDPGTVDIALKARKVAGETLTSLSLIAEADEYPIYSGPANRICMGETYRNALGEIVEGTRDCSPLEFCSATVRENCSAPTGLKVVVQSQITPEIIKTGVTLGDITGTYPSATSPLAANTAAVDLTSFGPTTTAGTYEFFDSAGNVYTATVADGGTITPTTANQTFSTAGTMYRAFVVAGDSDLTAAKIKNGTDIFGVTGDYPSAAQPLASNSGTTDLTSFGPATAAGNYEFFDSAGNVYTATVADGGTITPTTANQTFSTAGTMYRAFVVAGDSDLTAAKIKNGEDIFGVTGAYPSLAQPLATNTGATDLTSFGPATGAGNYEFFDSAGNVYTATVADGGTITPTTANQTFSTADTMYRAFVVAGDSDLTAAKIKNGEEIFGVTGSYPSLAQPLATNTGATDLTSFGPATGTGNYEFFDSAGNVYTATVADGGTITPTTANQTFSAADTMYRAFVVAGDSDLTAAKIKGGEDIFGVTGAFPSALNPLPGADGTADLDSATFDAKIKSATAFEWFGPDGSRYTGAGDSDITAGNIADGITIFGASGTAGAPTQCSAGDQPTCESDSACRWHVGACQVNPWHIRAGKTILSQAGTLAAQCRNTVDLSYFDIAIPKSATVDDGADTLTIPNHGLSSNDPVRISASSAPNPVSLNDTTYYAIVVDSDTIQLSSVMGPGGALDFTTTGSQVYLSKWQDGTRNIWDTIDSYYGYSSSRVSTWSAETACGASNWSDVTTLDGGSSLTTCGTSGTCIYKDELSELLVTAEFAQRSWADATIYCQDTTYGGYSAGTWRLPTQKELMTLYVHSIHAMEGASFIPDMDTVYWSSTTQAEDPTKAFEIMMSRGSISASTKTSTNKFFCVK